MKQIKSEKNKRVAVTGIGVTASNAVGKQSFYESCAGGTIGIKECTLFSTEKLMTRFFGEITGNLPDSTVIPTGETRMKAIMRSALEEMMRDSRFDRAAIESYGTEAWLCFGTLLATTDGIMEYAAAAKTGNIITGYLEHINDYLPWIRELCGIQGGSYVSSAACAAGTTAAGMAFDFIKNGLCKICVVGGADPLTKVTAAGFHALKSLSTGICNPYDEDRDGINIGEGAAFFIFEDMEAAEARNAHIYGEITGYGLANEAYHITSPDPEGSGAVAAMSEAVRESGIGASRVRHINGHGTGTPLNDSMEMNAINKLYDGVDITPAVTVTSTKALIGHCMGASGALELAALLLALENQKYLPLPNLKKSIKPDRTSSKGADCEIEYALSNSFAFAGNIASIAVRRYGENNE